MNVDEQLKRLQLKLAEAQVDLYTNLGMLDPRDLQADLDGWGMYPTLQPPYYQQSQKRGEVLPVYTTETQLRLIRDRSRKLCAENEFAICAIENRRSYVVGKGLVYRSTPARPDCDPALVTKVNEILGAFGEANELADVESDVMLRLDRDGEAFLRFFELPGGLVTIRPVEPEHVRAPVGDSFGAEYSFGVQTAADDIQEVLGYWIVEQPTLNPSPSFVPADEVLHLKLNTDRSAKRGLPTFYPVEPNLRRAEDLLASMTSMAKTRAKIALIRKFKGVAQSAAQSLVNSLTDVTATDPGTGQTVNMERLRWGTILNSTDAVEHEFPSGDVQASDFVQVLQAELRAVAARLCMPEWMLTVDASNANYSSSLVAEAPSTKMFERLQQIFVRAFGERRYGLRTSAAWRQLEVAIRRGALPADLHRWVSVQVECPSLTVRDKAAEASTNKTYMEAGIKSPQTITQELGLDYDQEQRNLARAKKDGWTGGQQPQPASQQPGTGDDEPVGNPGMKEAQHDVSGEKRDTDGKFTSGGGSGGSAGAGQAPLHGGVGDTAARMEKAAQTAKSRKELGTTMKVIAQQAKSDVKAAATQAIAKVTEEHLGSHPKELRSEMKALIREHVGDFANDLIGHISHETRYTIGQLKGGESKGEIQQALETAHENLGPEGVKEKFDFNSKYLRADLVDTLKSHGKSDAEAQADTIIASLAHHLGIAGNYT